MLQQLAASRFVEIKARKRMARVLLGVLIILAAVSAARRDEYEKGPLGPVTLDRQFLVHLFDDLNRFQAVHLLAHSTGFFLVAILLGPWGVGEDRGSAALVYTYTAVASVIWETGQAVAWFAKVVWTTDVSMTSYVQRSFDWGFISPTLFDFLVNGLAALTGLGVVYLIRSR